MLSIPGESWSDYAVTEGRRDDLVYPPEGVLLSYGDGVKHSAALLKDRPRAVSDHVAQAARCRVALRALADDFATVKPDIVVMISDDQEEWFYDNNMPMFSIFWGPSVPIVPRPPVGDLSPELNALIAAGYGDVPMDVPVAQDLATHLLSYLVEHDFDMAHSAYLDDEYGGRTSRRLPTGTGVADLVRQRKKRRQGLPHGFSFVVKNLLGNTPHPIVPISQNTCYPPNSASPRRSYAFGRAVGQAILEWDSDATVAVVASGGLSHFVTDEEFDRLLLQALERGDADALSSLPRHRLYSGTSESLNWVSVAAAMSAADKRFELIDYVAVYRTDAGTGGGWAFGRWR